MNESDQIESFDLSFLAFVGESAQVVVVLLDESIVLHEQRLY